MLRNPPPPWDGEWVTLYHGTLETFADSLLGGVDLRYAHAGRGLGRGLYAPALEGPGSGWAVRPSRGSFGLAGGVCLPVSLDGLGPLYNPAFGICDRLQAERPRGFVLHCRQNGSPHCPSTNGGLYDL